jgi:tetratricopeptide (TPR) repeat protein
LKRIDGVGASMDHTTATFLRIEAIFHDALAVPAESRSTLVAERCGKDSELRTEVLALLQASEDEEQITESRRTDRRADPAPLPERRRVGPYEIDRLLGRGGMGAVYLAHRADGQFEQQVAIKLIDLPLATDLFRERFRLERQILAGLQHPFIARLLDGGITADGDLYLAMEYVDGTPIHRYCREHKLSLTQKLNLFRNVCEAVQFAHQNLVVHRDLKPDNIFVAEDGTPRLLDFGTAKLTSPSLNNPESDLTRQGYHSFTPQYASPEQVLGNPITTASDTYSLGVLLYLLLTGSLPYELKEMTTAELVRVICQEPPRRPTADPDSGNRQANARLDPDLEAILLKALRKEPQERYRSAEQLASDIQRFLNGLPVGARRGTFRYRAVKFARRNRAAMIAASIVAVTLATGVAGIAWQAHVADQERRKAEARSADLRQLSNSLLSELNEAIQQLPGSTGVQKLLVTRVLEHLDRMAKDAGGDRQTQLDLVRAYTQLGEVQGNVYDQNLGDTAGALDSIGKALAIAEPMVASNPKDREALRALATAQEDRGEILSAGDDVPRTVAAMQAAVHTYDREIALPGTTPPQFMEAAIASETLGDELGQETGMADAAAGLVAYQKAIDLDSEALKLDPNFMRVRRGLAHMQFKVGNIELDSDPAQALRDLKISMQKIDALPDAERNKPVSIRLRAIVQRKQGVALSELGQYAQANPLFEEAVQTFRHYADLEAKGPLDVHAAGDLKRALLDQADGYEYAANPQLATSLAEQHANLLKAEQIYEQAAAVLARVIQQEPANQDWKVEAAYLQVRIASLQQILRIGTNAEGQSQAGLSILKTIAENDKASSMVLDRSVTAILNVEPASLRDPNLAVTWSERGVALTHRKVATWMLSLAQSWRTAGQLEKARATAREGLALLPNPQPDDPKSWIRKLLEFETR